MGFFKAVGNAIGELGSGLAQSGQEAKMLANEWKIDRKPDEFIVKKFRRGTLTEKMAASIVLKEYYPDEELRKEIFRQYF